MEFWNRISLTICIILSYSWETKSSQTEKCPQINVNIELSLKKKIQNLKEMKNKIVISRRNHSSWTFCEVSLDMHKCSVKCSNIRNCCALTEPKAFAILSPCVCVCTLCRDEYIMWKYILSISFLWIKYALVMCSNGNEDNKSKRCEHINRERERLAHWHRQQLRRKNKDWNNGFTSIRQSVGHDTFFPMLIHAFISLNIDHSKKTKTWKKKLKHSSACRLQIDDVEFGAVALVVLQFEFRLLLCRSCSNRIFSVRSKHHRIYRCLTNLRRQELMRASYITGAKWITGICAQKNA